MIFASGPSGCRHPDAVQAARARRALAEAELARSPSCRRQLDRRKRQWHLLAPHVGPEGSHLVDYEIHDNGSETWEINTKAHRHPGPERPLLTPRR